MSTQTRLYDTRADASAAVERLRAAQIPDADISLISPHDDAITGATGAASGAGVGAVLGGGAGLLAGAGLMAIPGLGPVVAAGWLAATLTGAVTGAVAGGVAGGVIEALVASGVDRDQAHVYAEGVHRGGTLVTVRSDDALDSTVARLLDQSNPVDVVDRERLYRSEGWVAFDPAARAIDESERQRSA